MERHSTTFGRADQHKRAFPGDHKRPPNQREVTRRLCGVWAEELAKGPLRGRIFGQWRHTARCAEKNSDFRECCDDPLPEFLRFSAREFLCAMCDTNSNSRTEPATTTTRVVVQFVSGKERNEEKKER